jgi:hypothetical protein
VVRDPGLPTLYGRYLYADYLTPGLRTLALEAPGADPRPAGLSGPEASDVVALGEDGCGRVYVVSIAGPVNRLADADVAPCAGPPAEEPGVTPPTGGTVPTGGGSGTVPDTRAPALRVGVAGRRGLAIRRRLRIAIRTDEPATVRVTGRLRGVARFRTTRRPVAAGRRTVLAVRISRASARKLRRTLRGKRVIAALSIRARDAAGNSSRTTRRIVIPRR